MKKTIFLLVCVLAALTLFSCNAIGLPNGQTAGEDGKSAYELACENGYDGTVEEWLASLVARRVTRAIRVTTALPLC